MTLLKLTKPLSPKDENVIMFDTEFTPFYLGEMCKILHEIYDKEEHGLVYVSSIDGATIDITIAGIVNINNAIGRFLATYPFFERIGRLKDIKEWSGEIRKWITSFDTVIGIAKKSRKTVTSFPVAKYEIGSRYKTYLDDVISLDVNFSAFDPLETPGIAGETISRFDELKKRFYIDVRKYDDVRDAALKKLDDVADQERFISSLRDYASSEEHVKMWVKKYGDEIKELEREKKELIEVRNAILEKRDKIRPEFDELLKRRSEINGVLADVSRGELQRRIDISKDVDLQKAIDALAYQKDRLNHLVSSLQARQDKYYDELERQKIKITPTIKANAPSVMTMERVKIERSIKELETIVERVKKTPSEMPHIDELRKELAIVEKRIEELTPVIQKTELEVKNVAEFRSSMERIENGIENRKELLRRETERLKRYKAGKKYFDSLPDEERAKLIEYGENDGYSLGRAGVFDLRSVTISDFIRTVDEMDALTYIVASFVFYVYTRDPAKFCEAR